MFWGSKAVQDSLGRLKKASKRHLKSSKTKQGSKHGLYFCQFLDHFWSYFGDHFGVQIYLKRGPKMGPVLEPASSG